MSEQVLLAIIGLAVATVAVVKIIVEGVNWTFRFLVEQLDKRQEAAEKRADKMLDQCAQERMAFLETLNTVLRELRSEMNAHTMVSKEMYHTIQGLKKE